MQLGTLAVAFSALMLMGGSAKVRLGDPLCNLCVSVVNSPSKTLTTETFTDIHGEITLTQDRTLTPIQWPDLTKVEPAVREQLLNLEKDVKVVLSRTNINDNELATHLGEAGMIYHAYSLFLTARDCYLNAAALAPKDFRWAYLLAKIDQQEGRTEDAIQRFTRAASLQADYPATQVNLGNIYLELNQLDKAEANFKSALALDATNAAALYGLGQSALSQRRYANAVGYFENALRQVPGANRIHYSLGLAYRGLGDTAKAESHLEQRGTVGIRVTDPLFDQLPELISSEHVYMVRGQTALNAKRYADAAAEFRKAIAAKPDSVTAHLHLAATLAQLNDLNGAINEFQTVIGLDPANTNARFNLAVAFASQKRHAEAAAALQALIDAKPNDFSARFFLAKELLVLKRQNEALAELLRVAEANPDNEEAVLLAVNLLGQAQQHAKALSLIERSHAQYLLKADTSATLAYLLATSPQIDLRNGARALELAQEVYKTTGLTQHGAVVSLALAELGRCAEAADWQRKLIAIAEQKQSERVAKLKSDLAFFETKGSCRPPAQ